MEQTMSSDPGSPLIVAGKKPATVDSRLSSALGSRPGQAALSHPS